jgi:hypothetical protein
MGGLLGILCRAGPWLGRPAAVLTRQWSHPCDRRVKVGGGAVVGAREQVAAQHELQAFADLLHRWLDVHVVGVAMAALLGDVGDDVHDARLSPVRSARPRRGQSSALGTGTANSTPNQFLLA